MDGNADNTGGNNVPERQFDPRMQDDETDQTTGEGDPGPGPPMATASEKILEDLVRAAAQSGADLNKGAGGCISTPGLNLSATGYMPPVPHDLNSVSLLQVSPGNFQLLPFNSPQAVGENDRNVQDISPSSSNYVMHQLMNFEVEFLMPGEGENQEEFIPRISDMRSIEEVGLPETQTVTAPPPTTLIQFEGNPSSLNADEVILSSRTAAAITGLDRSSLTGEIPCSSTTVSYNPPPATSPVQGVKVPRPRKLKRTEPFLHENPDKSIPEVNRSTKEKNRRDHKKQRMVELETENARLTIENNLLHTENKNLRQKLTATEAMCQVKPEQLMGNIITAINASTNGHSVVPVIVVHPQQEGK